MKKAKFNHGQFIDKETNTSIYGDYLPVDIIRNEVFLFNENKVNIQFILWKPITEVQERKFLTELRTTHKDEIFNVSILKPKEHYLIQAKPKIC